MSYTEHTHCRICRTPSLETVFDLGSQPLANDHCLPGDARQGLYPLKIMSCEKCGLAQLSAVVDKELLYRHYSYVSSSSSTMQKHYHRLFLDLESEQPEKTVVEIGSNNGDLLKFAEGRGWNVLGIDPAINICKIASEQGIPNIPEFFDTSSAHMALSKFPKPGVILARHVFAHIDDWHGFFDALKVLADTKTLIALEFPYLGDFLDKLSWDTAYHEHLNIVSLRPLVRLLAETPFHLHRVVRMGIHGGALLVMLRHTESGIDPHLSAQESLCDEAITLSDWNNFSKRAHSNIAQLSTVVQDLKKSGKIVCIFGASAKTTVMTAACHFDESVISFCTDNSPLKPGRLIPGTGIPIIHEEQMLSEHPDYAVMGAWNYATEILAKCEKWRSRGGKFLIPGAELRVV